MTITLLEEHFLNYFYEKANRFFLYVCQQVISNLLMARLFHRGGMGLISRHPVRSPCGFMMQAKAEKTVNKMWRLLLTRLHGYSLSHIQGNCGVLTFGEQFRMNFCSYRSNVLILGYSLTESVFPLVAVHNFFL